MYAAAAHQVLLDRALKMKFVKEGTELRAIVLEAVQLTELKNFGCINTTGLTNSKANALLAQVKATLVVGREINRGVLSMSIRNLKT